MSRLPAADLTPPPYFAASHEALAWINGALKQAAVHPRDPWHTAAISYLCSPDQTQTKTLVLRAYSQERAELIFYTDTRSAKWAALSTRPRLSALLYCPRRQTQLSLKGLADLRTGTPEEEALFAALPLIGQQAYISQSPPGTRLSTGAAPAPKTYDPKLAARYFGQIALRIESFDFVSLHDTAHQRLAGRSLQDETGTCWLIP